jgi:hypothetical protein
MAVVPRHVRPRELVTTAVTSVISSHVGQVMAAASTSDGSRAGWSLDSASVEYLNVKVGTTSVSAELDAPASGLCRERELQSR